MRQLMKPATILVIAALLACFAASSYAKRPDNPGGGGTGDGDASYTIVPFAPFNFTGSKSRIDSLNEEGTAAVGHSTLPSGEMLWAHFDLVSNTYTTFPSGIGLADVNNRNQMVGALGENWDTAAFWSDPLGDPLVLPPLEGHAVSYATSLNDDGIVLGLSSTANFATKSVVVWRVMLEAHTQFVVDGPLPLPSLPGDTDTGASKINELIGGVSQIVGESRNDAGSEAVVWTVEIDENDRLIAPAPPHVLGTLDLTTDSWSSGTGLNNHGVAVGQSDKRPFVTDASGPMEQLPVTRKTIEGVAWDVNDANEVVGELSYKEGAWSPASGVPHAYLWKDGDVIDLATRIDQNSGWSDLWHARQISNDGVIAGYGNYDGERGFLLIPSNSGLLSSGLTLSVPEPTTGAVIACGLVSLLTLTRRRMKTLAGLVLLLLFGLAADATTTRAAEFVPLGPAERVEAVSFDGNAVAGSLFNPVARALKWNSQAGWVDIGDLPGGFTSSLANAISENGTIVVGESNSTIGREAFRWEESTGITGLGHLPGHDSSIGHDVSADGSVVVGESDSTLSSSLGEAFRWNANSGMVGLGALPGDDGSIARGVSADGSTIAGTSYSTGVGGQAVRWTEADGIVPLGFLNPDDFESSASDISADGSTLVGYNAGPNGQEAFRWTVGGGMEGLGKLSPSDFGSLATATSANGAIVVGTSDPGSSLNDYRAFVWDETHGMRSVQNLLVAEGLDLGGWKLNWATGVSADGSTIVGWGKNPSGHDEGWLARINSVPEPSGVVLAGLALFSLMARCRLRRHQKLPR